MLSAGGDLEEIERLAALMRKATSHVTLPVTVDPCASCYCWDLIDELASLARRLLKENVVLADQAFEANADAVKAYKECDEARRLHDEHCPRSMGCEYTKPWKGVR